MTESLTSAIEDSFLLIHYNVLHQSFKIDGEGIQIERPRLKNMLIVEDNTALSWQRNCIQSRNAIIKYRVHNSIYFFIYSP